MADDMIPENNTDPADDHAELSSEGWSGVRTEAELIQDPERTGLRSITEDYLRVYDETEALANGKRPLDGTPTGLSLLDLITGGLRPGCLYVLASRPGQGRTSLALGIASYAASIGRPATFFAPGLRRKDVAQRVLCAQANIESYKITEGKLTEDEWMEVARTVKDTFDVPLFIDNKSELTVQYVLAQSRIDGGIGADVVIINGLELMESAQRRPSREEEIVEVMLDLKRAARELDIPLFVTCGVSGGARKRSFRRPQLWDLPAGLEEIADGVFFLYQHSESPRVTLVELTELIIAKNPDGPTGMVHVGFAAAFRKFVDWPETADDPSGF